MEDLSVMVGDVKFNFRVGLVILNNGKVLLEKGNDSDYSVIPGGRVKILESTKDALVREIKEELEISFTKDEFSLLNIVENFFIHKNVKFHEILYVYKIEIDDNHELANINNITNKDTGESTYKWVKLRDIENTKILPSALKDIIKTKEFNTTIVDEIRLRGIC